MTSIATTLMLRLTFLLAPMMLVVVHSQTILDVAQDQAPEFGILTSIIGGIPDLVTKLDCTALWCSTYTVFAPNNASFAAVDQDFLDKLTSEPYEEHLRALILYHMVRGRVKQQDILAVRSFQVQSVFGEFLYAAGSASDGIQINTNANVLTSLEASNGLMHAIDALLLPSFVTSDIVSIAEDVGMFSTLLQLAVDAGVVEDLQSENITLFAPTDEAFSNLDSELVDALLADPTGALRDVLLYHAVPFVLPRTKITAGPVTTIQGDDIMLNWIGIDRPGFSFFATIQVNSAVEVVQNDIFALNGIIHAIDEVLIPPSLTMEPRTITTELSKDPRLTTLSTLLSLSGLNETLDSAGPFTILAPTNDAFGELDQVMLDELEADLDGLSNLLLYHTFDTAIPREQLSAGIVTPINGNNLHVNALRTGVTFNKFARVETFNIPASNGIIHVLDQVLVPPPTLIGIINSSPDFSILVEAIIAAGLIDTLEGGPFTVFAPTNEAFNKLDELLTDPGTVLRDILLYHIVPGNVLLNDLTNGPLTTVQGEDIAVTLNTFQGSTFVSSATLNGQSTTTSTDIVASNGVVFVIDTVLVPPSIAGPPADPTSAPSEIPSEAPSAAGPVGGQGPTTEPPTLSSDVPSVVPSVTPSMLPSDVPSEGPSSQPSVMTNPSAAMPTETLSAMPSLSPSMLSAAPSLPPTDLPSVAPTVLASSSPTGAPSSVPSTAPSRYPSISPSGIPSSVPSTTPSFSLSDTPSSVPSVLPSESLNPTSTPPHAYDLLSSSSEFTNLTSAIDVVGLENSFRGPGPFTVFAPTDDAFAKLPDGLLDALFLDIPTLRQIILYHVLSGELRRSTDFTTGDIFTIGDEPVSVQVSSNDITLNGSINITKADVVASNSLIHELDGVLIPPSLTA